MTKPTPAAATQPRVARETKYIRPWCSSSVRGQQFRPTKDQTVPGANGKTPRKHQAVTDSNGATAQKHRVEEKVGGGSSEQKMMASTSERKMALKSYIYRYLIAGIPTLTAVRYDLRSYS
jgi:hypothetical protein